MKKESPKKIAVFGSAFNPPSLGHKSVVNRLGHFDLVLLVPSIAHAWGKKMPEFEQRCIWLNAFIKDLEQANVSLCDIEKQLLGANAIDGKKDPVTTWAVLEKLQNQYPDSELTFVIGPDNFLNFSKFYKAEQIVERWSLLASPETIKIRSTDIRKALELNEDISTLTTQGVAKLLKA